MPNNESREVSLVKRSQCRNGMSSLPPATKLGQGNIFTGVCDSVHRGGCLFPGDASSWGVPGRGVSGEEGSYSLGGVMSQGGAWSWGVSRPTVKGEVEGDLVQAHSQGGNWGGSAPDPHPRGKLRGTWLGGCVETPIHPWRLLLGAVCIQLECILVMIIRLSKVVHWTMLS